MGRLLPAAYCLKPDVGSEIDGTYRPIAVVPGKGMTGPTFAPDPQSPLCCHRRSGDNVAAGLKHVRQARFRA
jgi:hypothetical protein